ncbi:unnamed protein product [Brassica rapa]|uniref:DUF4408 domain-containing protein n=2 Tax=Brassica TaxID=3705 RepID=A0A3P5ZVA2_BRACM|nr:uncharacterized protein BNAA03G52880D [Brassica napus]CAF2133046.1 unnamed protein product [Brassica napus]CAG7885120.1 unnamed protein product [Brassica rapa]CDY45315.1 BnaA03g52880D [Brassica napus]VDC84152.1 unnamed protein product [Brassica rapa]
MDSVQFQHFKMKKPRGFLNFQTIRSFKSLFRLIELILLLILISKLSFPSVKLSTDIFRGAAEFLVSPRFVFFIGNAIVITLFAISRRYNSAHEPISKTTEAVSNDLYQEFLQESEKKRSEVYETSKTEQPKKPSGVKRLSFERSQSQKAFEVVHPPESTCGGRVMKRYESEKHLRICDTDKKVVVRGKKPEDKMSNEQFRTKIEAFIARQKRIQKDDEHLII